MDNIEDDLLNFSGGIVREVVLRMVGVKSLDFWNLLHSSSFSLRESIRKFVFDLWGPEYLQLLTVGWFYESCFFYAELSEKTEEKSWKCEFAEDRSRDQWEA